MELNATRVILGLADGTDQWVAAAAWKCSIPFVGVLPWRGHRQGSVAQDWCLRHAEQVVEINPSQSYPGPSVYHERNEWIVAHSDVLLAVWDGKRTGGTFQTVRRAMLRDMPVRQINPLTRKISSFNMDKPEASLFSALDNDEAGW